MDTLPEDAFHIEIETACRGGDAARQRGARPPGEPLRAARHRPHPFACRDEALPLHPAHEARRHTPGRRSRDSLQTRITETALAALRLVDALLAENISEDQRGSVQARPLYAEFRARLQEFLLAGGGGFLETRQTDARSRRPLRAPSRRRCGNTPARTTATRPWTWSATRPSSRRLLLVLFPVMIREHPERPPYGIEEGEEVIYSSQNMKLPLSQAIFYMENELLPELEKKLAENPGQRVAPGGDPADA